MWVTNIVNLLRLEGEDNYKRLADVGGIIGLKHHPYDDFDTRLARETAKRDLTLADGRPATRWISWSTHSSPSSENYGFDVRNRKSMKYIGIVRNGFEVLSE